MSDVKAEIIAVGTELLLGQISNTNAQWISKQLADNGIDVHFHEVVGG
ncbi:molybdopterin-binding protein [Virgibacillus halophilus]|uniref:Molybdopterin-binding protein n=1 Tax=Tigheibacillus halophilus TaxID=361280 RepID=A0ABU5CC56_9BACI|nr:molybdopterin-binding protein [Virgibacillus halophilus]